MSHFSLHGRRRSKTLHHQPLADARHVRSREGIKSVADEVEATLIAIMDEAAK